MEMSLHSMEVVNRLTTVCSGSWVWVCVWGGGVCAQTHTHIPWSLVTLPSNANGHVSPVHGSTALSSALDPETPLYFLDRKLAQLCRSKPRDDLQQRPQPRQCALQQGRATRSFRTESADATTETDATSAAELERHLCEASPPALKNHLPDALHSRLPDCSDIGFLLSARHLWRFLYFWWAKVRWQTLQSTEVSR